MALGLKTQPKGWLKSIMDRLDLNEKTLSTHVHDDRYYTETEINEKEAAIIDRLNTNEQTLSAHVHDDRYYTETEIDNKMAEKAPLANPALTGMPTAPTASAGTNSTQIATTAFVQTAISNGIAASDAMIIKGTIGTSGTVTALPTTYKTGWTYRVVTDGTYAGQECEIGDLITALVDRNGSGNADSDWCVAQTNINGAITRIKSGDAYIAYSQSGSVVTITHKDVTRSNTSSSTNPSHGGTFTAVKSVTSDSKGHVTGVDTETITLPTYGVATESAAGLESAEDKKKLNGIATGAEVNQNAFSNVVVGTTTIAADSKTDSLTFEAGSNITLTPDANKDKVTISSKDTIYTHPSYTSKSNGLYKVTVDSTGHVSGTTAVSKSDITKLGVPERDTVTTVNTTGNGNVVTAIQDNGDGSITATKGATFLTAHPTISTSSNTTSTASPAHGRSFTVIDSITKDSNGHVTKFNTKTVTLPGDNNTDTMVAQALTTSNADYPLLLAPSGQTKDATTTTYFDSGVTLNPSTNIINAHISGNAATATKLANARTIALTGSVTGSGSFDGSGNLSITTSTNHTHSYAGSSSVGGSATSAVKLDSSAGSVTQPVYFSSGKPVACTYTLGKSVPSNAVFTDTVYTHPTTSGNKHIPSGGSSGAILKWSSDGTAKWESEYSYTHPSYEVRIGVPTTDITPGFGETFSVSQPMSDSKGHITSINARKVTLPSNTGNTTTAGLTKLYDTSGTNTDGAVTQNLFNTIINSIIKALGTTDSNISFTTADLDNESAISFNDYNVAEAIKKLSSDIAALILTLNNKINLSMRYTLLGSFASTVDGDSTTITLSDNINNYKFIYVMLSGSETGGTHITDTKLIPADMFRMLCITQAQALLVKSGNSEDAALIWHGDDTTGYVFINYAGNTVNIYGLN